MNFFGHAVFTENPDSQECGFHEEGQQSFHRQRSAENIAHVAGIFRPVHAELKFLHDAGDNADGKVDQE